MMIDYIYWYALIGFFFGTSLVLEAIRTIQTDLWLGRKIGIPQQLSWCGAAFLMGQLLWPMYVSSAIVITALADKR